MHHLPDTDPGSRNYATISPSAKSLLLLKGHTTIPYAREAAALIIHPGPYTPDFSNRQAGFWTRVVHFEQRYGSIDQLLSDLDAKNILELSSGFSFRGLALCRDREVSYIDTDLPDIIVTKKALIREMTKNEPAPKGRLELLPLNALDEEQFEEIEKHFPPGEIVIVNEGLLMYLGMPEKERLCRFICKLLQRRGGYWITADIYLKKRLSDPELDRGDTFKQFLEQHRVEDNMFTDFEEAAAFFSRMGFVVDKEARPAFERLSTASYFMASVSPELLVKMQKFGKIQATWRLRVGETG